MNEVINSLIRMVRQALLAGDIGCQKSVKTLPDASPCLMMGLADLTH